MGLNGEQVELLCWAVHCICSAKVIGLISRKHIHFEFTVNTVHWIATISPASNNLTSVTSKICVIWRIVSSIHETMKLMNKNVTLDNSVCRMRKMISV